MIRHRFSIFLSAVFAAKLIVTLQLRHHPLLQSDAGLDAGAYAHLASQVISGQSPGSLAYVFSPLYVYFLAAVLGAAKNFIAVRMAQIALGTAAVGFVFVAAREWFGERAGWLAAICAALTGLFTYYEVLIVPAALDPVLTGGALAALAIGLRPARRRSVWIALSLLLAAGLVLNRSNMLVGGVNFYFGNNAEADGAYQSVAGFTPNPEEQREQARRIADASSGRTLTDRGASVYFFRLGWAWIRLHPGDALGLFARKLFFVLNRAHIPLNDSFPFYAYDARTLLALLFVGPWLLVPLGMAGLVLGATRVERRRPFLVWASVAPIIAVSVALFFASDRYRLALLVPLCVGAGGAIDRIVRPRVRAARFQKEGFVLIALISFGAIAVWPAGVDEGRTEERTRMAEAMVVHEQLDEAERWTKKAVEGAAKPGPIHSRVGRQLLAHHKPGAALVHLERALQLDPAQPDAEYALGQALAAEGRPNEAIPHLERGLTAGVRADLAGLDLARARAAIGDRAGALQILQSVRPDDPADAQSWGVLGELALQLQSPSLAAAFFTHAVAAAPRSSKARQDLGVALAMTGRSADAIAQFEQAVRLDPRDPVAQLSLAVVYADSGRKAEARAHAREALRLNPSYDRARQFLRALR